LGLLKDEGESLGFQRVLLKEILQKDVQKKYYLSARACAGILRRAEKRGKELPPVLRTALLQVSHCAAETTKGQAQTD
jgi:hypothetical protein